MKLQRVKIANFRCFGPDGTTINLQQSVTAFVGNNGSGKTAIFSALGKLFGTTAAQRAITKRDFHLGDGDDDIESGATLYVDCTFGFPELDGGDAEDDAIPEVFNNMFIGGEGDPLRVRLRLSATWTDDGTPEGFIEEEFRWIDTLDDDFEWDDCAKVQAVERNFIQLVYVPASRNAYEQVTNLLKGRLWKAARWSNELARVVGTASTTVQEQFDGEGPASFISERLISRWEEVNRGDTKSDPSLKLVDHKLVDLVRRAEFVFEDEDGRQTHRLDELSDGQRSLFHIALTAATLEIEQDALNDAASPFDQEKLRRTHLTLLAIEEPENSLSPFFLSRIMSQANEIGALSTAQVLISSHSASILSRVDAVEVRYCRLNSDNRRSEVRSLILPPDGTEANTYIRLAVKAYPELYFARFVILAEGDSESVLIPRIADAMDFPLDKSFIPIVPLGGRFVGHFWRLLNDLQIPHATLLDLDLGRRHGGKNAIAYIVRELAAVGRTMADNAYVVDEHIDLDALDEIENEELADQDQEHQWLQALQEEGVFFSSPIDIDFAMLALFPSAYKHARPGGRGPKLDDESAAQKKGITLKTGGAPELYEDAYEEEFGWYPYLFLSDSKPQTHLLALGRIEPLELAQRAPVEIRKLIERVKDTVSR